MAKKIGSLLIIPAFIICLLSSCQKTDIAPAYDMYANINGYSWAADNGASATNDCSTISITGFSSDGSYFNIFVPANIGCGTYEVSNGSSCNVWYVSSQSYSMSGSITINSVSNQGIQGSFCGSAYNDNNCQDVLQVSGNFTAWF